jgi:hypothetical protein
MEAALAHADSQASGAGAAVVRGPRQCVSRVWRDPRMESNSTRGAQQWHTGMELSAQLTTLRVTLRTAIPRAVARGGHAEGRCRVGRHTSSCSCAPSALTACPHTRAILQLLWKPRVLASQSVPAHEHKVSWSPCKRCMRNAMALTVTASRRLRVSWSVVPHAALVDSPCFPA